MTRCEVDHSVYYHHDGKGLAIIIAAVDDLTIVTSGTQLMGEVKFKAERGLQNY